LARRACGRAWRAAILGAAREDYAKSLEKVGFGWYLSTNGRKFIENSFRQRSGCGAVGFVVPVAPVVRLNKWK
jgi:hypothetical protein